MNQKNKDDIAEFARAARVVCENLEGRGPLQLVPLARALAQLHVGALGLPDVEPTDAEDDGLGKGSARPLELSSLAVDIYWDVFNPLQTPPDEPVANSLIDDLSDIRLDLLRGLRLFDAGNIVDAGWLWRLDFYAHWGEHLVGAQRMLHLMLR